MPRRVVVTGLGAMSPNGIGKKKFWSNTCNGISGIRPISSFDPTSLSCQIAGEVQGFDPSDIIQRQTLKNFPDPYRWQLPLQKKRSMILP